MMYRFRRSVNYLRHWLAYRILRLVGYTEDEIAQLVLDATKPGE